MTGSVNRLLPERMVLGILDLKQGSIVADVDFPLTNG